MQKVILDTNIVVSALIQKSYPHYVVDYVLDGKISLCLSEALLSEYCDVLFRPKFANIAGFKRNAEIVLNRFEKIASFYEPEITLDIIKDRSDNKLLELADESNADFLITGNSVDFTFTHYKNTQILSPRSFWELLIE
ncbi:PIN domain-containing protein [Bacteroidia bacterium]|nr:PIN domain-containing protein [Bacteroidia bacterium]